MITFFTVTSRHRNAFCITDRLWGNLQLNKESSCRWFQTPWRSCDVTAMLQWPSQRKPTCLVFIDTRLFAHIIRLHCDKRNKTQLSRDINEIDSIWWYSHLRHTTTGKYDNNGKDWYQMNSMISIWCTMLYSVILNDIKWMALYQVTENHIYILWYHLTFLHEVCPIFQNNMPVEKSRIC